MKKHRKPKSKPSDADYVNNAQFYEALKEYRALRLNAEKQGLPRPKIPDYIGESIMKIATRSSYSWNFINYPYREEMVSNAIVNCITYLDNFDPEKSKSAFCYFSQICWFAFINVINREKKEKYTQYKFAESQNKKDFYKWFNETYAGIDVGRKEFFGLTDTDMTRFSQKNGTGRKSKRRTKIVDEDNPLGL